MAAFQRPSWWEPDMLEQIRQYGNQRPLRNVILATSFIDGLRWVERTYGRPLADDEDTRELLIRGMSGKIIKLEVINDSRSIRGHKDINIVLCTDDFIRRFSFSDSIGRAKWVTKGPIDIDLLNLCWVVKSLTPLLMKHSNKETPPKWDFKPIPTRSSSPLRW